MSRLTHIGITVVDVCRQLGIEPNPTLMWSVGALAQAAYVAKFGHSPPKDLRAKTYTEGVHCFAIYPESFRLDIVDIIREHETERAQQLDVFTPDDPEAA